MLLYLYHFFKLNVFKRIIATYEEITKTMITSKYSILTNIHRTFFTLEGKDILGIGLLHYGFVHAYIYPGYAYARALIGYMPKSQLAWHIVCISSTCTDNIRSFKVVDQIIFPQHCNNSS